MIGIILPTRGLVFSEVEHAIAQNNYLGLSYEVFRSWNKTIPDAPNFLVQQALKNTNISHLWFIEEDTVPPLGAFADLFEEHADIACIDYGVNGWSCTMRDRQTSEILWCGLGCTLVKREVFEKMTYPYFRTDKALRLNDWHWIDMPKERLEKEYGGHDVWFCQKALELGFHIAQVVGECKHLRLDSLGKVEVNKGLHQISQKTPIQKQQYTVIPKPEVYLTVNGHSVSMSSIGNISH